MIDIQPARPAVSNSEFLRHLAMGLEPGQSMWVDHFIGDPDKAHWGGIWYTPDDPHRPDVDSWHRYNTYFSVAGLVPAEDKGVFAVRRRMANFGRLAALVLDDFDLDELKAGVSYVLETSPGKHQVGVFLDASDADCADHALVRKLTAQIVVKAGLAADKSGNNMVRLVRLPQGQNQKPRDSGHWDHRLTRWDPEVRYTLEDAAAVFGVDLDVVKAELVAEPAVRTGVSQATNAVDRVAELTRNILAGENLHDSLRDLAAHKIACGMVEGAVVNDLRALCSLSAAAGTDRMRGREADIQRAVDGAQKFAPKAPALVPVEAPPAKAPQGIPAHLLSPGGMLQVSMDWMNATATRSQPGLSLACAVSLLATALGQKVMSHTGLRTNIYFVSVGLTSTGKEHGRECVINALTKAGMGGSQLTKVASAAALCTRLSTSPVTLLQPDEFGLTLKSARSKGSPQADVPQMFMEVFSKAGQVIAGTVYADPSKREAKDIVYPCLGINATTTPGELWGALEGSDIESGLLNRLLMVFTPDARPRPSFPEKTPPPAELVEWLEAAQQLIGPGSGNLDGVVGGNPYVMRLSPPVRLALEELTDAVEERLNAGDIDGTAGLWARVIEHVWKLAMVCECSQYAGKDLLAAAADGTLEIGPKAWGWATELVMHLTGRAVIEIRSNVGSTDFGKLKAKAVERVVAAGVNGITTTMLIDRVRGLQGIPKRGVTDILEAAKMAGLIVSRTRDGWKRGPVEVWVDATLVEPEPGDEG